MRPSSDPRGCTSFVPTPWSWRPASKAGSASTSSTQTSIICGDRAAPKHQHPPASRAELPRRDHGSPLRTVYVVISCDVDPDRERFLDGVPPGGLTWRGVTEGIPAVKSAVRGLTDTTGREPVFTWFLRADEQIRQLQGQYGWFARSHASLLRSLQESGDELGWHPHFWRRDAQNGAWFQEVEDLDWQVDMLHKAHSDLATCFPGALKS